MKTEDLQKKLKRMKNVHAKRLVSPDADFYIATGKANAISKEIQILEQQLKIGETKMEKIHIALMEIKTCRLASELIEEVTVEQFEEMNKNALKDKTGYKYIQVMPLVKEVEE